MYEHRNAPLLSRRAYLKRLGRHALAASVIVGISLAVGTLGYHALAGLPWVDALYNAAMILTGMGPVAPLRTAGAKLFASAYALFSGIAFLTTVAVVLAPVVHRFLHGFHLDLKG